MPQNTSVITFYLKAKLHGTATLIVAAQTLEVIQSMHLEIETTAEKWFVRITSLARRGTYFNMP